ncbi:4a-hydroxytetrahydrobiopterin dehydratase [Candidatus Saccharibacteria bacterium]|nr:4a-hydroxytetrahydrobiopterin dehydratase [Candidatus Saccharibacteria bacterium]
MWQETSGELHKQFVFDDFKQAFTFMTKVAELAEKSSHHPRWQNEWNKVDIWLSTHEAGNKVTSKDRQLASAIDKLLLERAPLKKVSTKAVKLFADGGSRGNPGPSASGYALLHMDDQVIYKKGLYLGIATNNQAEYKALKSGLQEAYKLGAREVSVFMDSQLVINQMKGIYRVRNKALWPIHSAIQTMVGKFDEVTFTHVPRELNKLADSMVNEALDVRKK